MAETAYGKFDEVGGLGEGAFGESLLFVIESGDLEEGFASFLAPLIVVVSFDFQFFYASEVWFFSENGELGIVGEWFSAFIENELVCGAVPFESVDLGEGEDESVEGVRFTEGEGDDVFEFELWQIIRVVFFTGEWAVPVEVHGDTAFSDESTGDGERGSIFFEVGHGGFEVTKAVVEFARDFFGGFARHFFDFPSDFDGDVDLIFFFNFKFVTEIIEKAIKNEEAVANKVVIGEFIERAFLEKLIEF